MFCNTRCDKMYFNKEVDKLKFNMPNQTLKSLDILV